jgi:hypothetical protein
MAKTLAEWREAIAENAPRVDKAPYSHNIINISLQAIANAFGKAEANRAIRDFKLARKGWQEIPEDA